MTNGLDTGTESKEAAATLSQQYPDLKRLARAIRRSEGAFSLFFAECNLPLLRQQLATELTQQLEVPPVIVKLSELNTDAESIDSLIAQQLTHCPDNAAVFLFDLEQLLPTLSREKLRSTVQLLNWRRSELSRLNRPLLIWLPRYAIDVLAEETPDFYDWYSGIFSFSAQEEQRNQSEQAAFAGLWSDTGIHAAKHMNAKEKKKWLGVLKELLEEHQAQDKQRGLLLSNLGYLLESMGDTDKALYYYQQSLQITKEVGDKAGEGTILNNISGIYSARGDFDTALKYLKQALQIKQKVGDKAGEGATFNNIATTTHARGDFDTALKYLKQALQIRQEIGDKAGEGTTLNNISIIYSARGDFDTALKYLKQALQIQQKGGDKAGEGITLNNISIIYRARGDFDTALKYLKQALQIQQKIGGKAGEGTTLNNISGIYSARGDLDTALKYLKQSFQIRQEIGDIAGLCNTLFNMGHIHWENKRYEEAKSDWATVYRLAKKMNLAQALEALESLAPQIGLEGGLAGWEALANQVDSQEGT